MKPVRSASVARLLALLFCATFVGAYWQQPAFAQQGLTAQYFEGVWRITKVVAPDGVADANPEPGLSIFSGGHFSITRVTSREAREPAPLPANPAQLTDAEKIARHDEWAPFGAAAGTYEMRGDTLVTHNVVAKAARNMTLTEQATIQRIDADTFIATAQTPGDPNIGRQTTYSRVR
jgi:hypothetical protein